MNGTFRSVCRDSMGMFREGKESIIAVLQSFVSGNFKLFYFLKLNIKKRSGRAGNAQKPKMPTSWPIGRAESKSAESRAKSSPSQESSSNSV